MKQVLNYDIHDILRFQIVRAGKFGFRNLMNLRFSCFETETVKKPDIVLNIGEFTPSNSDCYLIDYKYHIKDNYFYCKESDGKARWEMEITGLEYDDTIINLNVRARPGIHPFDLLRVLLFLPQSFLLRIIEHKLGTKGYFLTHSAAVSKDNQAYLLSGRAGGFKTSLCMDFVRRAGFDCMGDDRVILNKGKVSGFPMNSAIFDFMSRHLPDETHFGIFQQLRFIAEQLKGNHEKSGGKELKPSELKALLLVARSTDSSATKKVNFKAVSPDSPEEIADNLILGARLEDFSGMGLPSLGISSAPFLRYMLAYSFVFPNSSVAMQERRSAESLRNSLEKIPIYRIEIPPVYSLDTFNQIHEFIDKNC